MDDNYLSFTFVVQKQNIMSAKDTIAMMDNTELFKYYNYCLLRNFENAMHNQNTNVYIHPSRGASTAHLKQGKPFYAMAYNNEIYLINEMLRRYENAESIAQQIWWGMMMKRINVDISYEFYYPHSEYDINKISYDLFLKTRAKTETIKFAGVEYTCIGSGLKRKVYYNKERNEVIKVPYNTLGIEENETEAKIYNSNENNSNNIYAKCSLLKNGNLQMEYVIPITDKTEYDALPNWTRQIAEGQVGYTTDGRLVAYDYGSDI